MTIEEIVLAYVAKQYNIPEEQVAELLYEKSEDGKKINKEKIQPKALENLLNRDKERVTAIKDSVDTSEIFTQAQNKAKKEVLTKEEKRLAKKYGIKEEGIKMDDLVAKIIEVKSEEAVKAAEGDLNDDKVKSHPTYLTLERTKNQEIQKLETDHEKAIKEIQDGYQKTQTFETVKSQVLTYFDSLKPILSKDGAKAANQRESFASLFSNFDYKEQEGSDEYLIMKDGKRVEDAHGNPLTLKDLTQQTADKYYDFAVQDPKGAPGNTGGGGGNDVKVPKSQDEYDTMIIEATSSEERASITQAWEASSE